MLDIMGSRNTVDATALEGRAAESCCFQPTLARQPATKSQLDVFRLPAVCDCDLKRYGATLTSRETVIMEEITTKDHTITGCIPTATIHRGLTYPKILCVSEKEERKRENGDIMWCIS